MTDLPETTYDGRVAGFPATRAQAGERFAATGTAVRQYRSYLRGQQDQTLSRIGNPSTLYRYTTALNGFAAYLRPNQVRTLRQLPNVLSVHRDRVSKPDTVDTPEFLGLSGRNGVWAQHGGPRKAGKGIVVGVIDTGIWPENPSFAGDRPVGRVPGFRGKCQIGERWTRSDCNSKVVSARYFIEGYGEDNIANHEYVSPRDGDGHGSHTASTAAGNHGVKITIDGQSFGRASGMAPAARIAAYKVCWAAPDPDNDGCFDSDSIAAINRAVRDGVDVLNYSISGTQDFLDPVELAFLGAAAGGVFVAASAGNNGPFRSTVAHPSPWLTTVAASTHRLFQGAVVLGNGKSYVGAMISDDAVSESRIVLSSRVAKPDADPGEASLCYLGTLDRSKVRGRIVVCDRGIIDRVEKSAAVERAGGVGMVLVNTAPDEGEVADFHSVPTVHLDNVRGAKVKKYVRNAGRSARASLNPSARDKTKVPQIAGFSSRGPLPGAVGDILKPDLSAPGVDVIAAVAPPTNEGRRWNSYSGTSMSSPHVAGLGALIQRQRPGWSPAMVKSAMMTTAYNLAGQKGPFVQGAGHVRPRRFLDPGLVYDARFDDWWRLLTGQRSASNTNQASIAIGDLVGPESVLRKVTNVSTVSERYTASVKGMRGMDVQVSPRRFTVAPGLTKRFTVSFTPTDDSQYKKYATGKLVLTGNRGHVVRSPMVVQPLEVVAPDEVSGSGANGSQTIRGIAGFTGQLNLAVTGLEGAVPQAGTATVGANPFAAPIASHTVPAGTAVARFDLDSQDNADDLDLYIAVGNTLVALSATGAADEQVTLTNPPAATYDVYVDAFAASGGPTSPYTYTGWVVPNTDQGNLTVAPDPVAVQAGERFSYTATWAGLAPGERHFGFVRYVGARERTYVTIN